MALPAPNLDDRRFQDIVDEAKRLIPRYCPEWTNHNLADPGVALIELFAWMSEMILFRLNQVPDKLYVHFLELVGIEPFPPSVARANLTFWLSTVLDHPVRVPAGTEVATTGASAGGNEVLFSTIEDLVIAPPKLFTARTGRAGNDQYYADVWDDLRFVGAETTCFTSTPVTPGDALYLGFEDNLAGNAIRLAFAARIEGIGVDPGNPPLAWDGWSGEAWVPLVVHSDTTGGLNRDGAITLLLPLGMHPLSIGGTRAFWLRGRLTELRPGQSGYKSSPRVGSVRAESLGGTVAAEHAMVVGPESLGRSDGRPAQTFAVARPPVLPRRDDEGVRVVTLDGNEVWEEVSDFSGSGKGDRHYVWDGATGTITFGPSVRYSKGDVIQHGAIPADNAEIIVDRYRHGGGAVGNVGAGTLTVLRTTVAFIDRVGNGAAAVGGADAETVRNAKLRGPLTLRTGQRAVTGRDFERLTLESSVAVARARCLPPTQVGAPIRMLVVPHVRRDPESQELDDFALSDDLISEIRDHLEERRILGTTVEIGTPFYQGVTVAVLMHALPGRPTAQVQQRALDLLYRYINPLVGGPDGNGWPFDTDLNAAPLTELLEAVEGVERVDEVLLFEYDLRWAPVPGRSSGRYGPGRQLIRLDRQSLFLSAHHQVVVR